MDVFTLYVAQGSLAAVRAGDEAIIVDAHMPTCDDLTPEHICKSLDDYLKKHKVRGLILTGLDDDHACPTGVEYILSKYEPDWVMYPTYYKDTDTASEVFAIIDRHVKRRKDSNRPLQRRSVRVDTVDSRYFTDLGRWFKGELFSPHMEDMDCSNNCSIVLKLSGLDPTGFNYLITGDTETDRWERINSIFGAALASDVMAAPHHGAKSGVHPHTLLLVSPHTVLISAGVDNQYGHPDPTAVLAYKRVAKKVYATNMTPDGTCLFTRRVGSDFDTRLVRHSIPIAAAS
jgi:beta-lactamase superfamily II metal-dependent hydrolase